MPQRSRAVALALLLGPLAPGLHAGSLDLGGARLVVSGEFLATLAPRERGYFNFTDYGTAPLRQARLDLATELRRGETLALVAELRARSSEALELSALYLRLRPRPGVDLQAGRIPPVFGGSARRGYGTANPLVSLPLAYQYLTSLRADARPPSAEALLRWRGGGWRPGYAPGDAAGLPLVQGELRDTGIELRLGGDGAWQVAAALTQGSPSRPLVRDDNDGKAVSARVQRRCGAALLLGASAARGRYLSSAARGARPGGDVQRALGLDAEFARGRVLLRAEAVRSAWDAPSVRERPLRAWAVSAEGRLRVAPLVDLAARLERLAFDGLRGSAGRDTWDACVKRLEAGATLRLRHDAGLKLVFQQNWRAGGYVRSEGLVVAQLGVRF